MNYFQGERPRASEGVSGVEEEICGTKGALGQTSYTPLFFIVFFINRGGGQTHL